MALDLSPWTGRISELAAVAGVPGVVLGVLADGEVSVLPYGVLSTRTGVPTTRDSVFQIGSITKTWTATMVAQLVEEGRLAYDATVADVLPGVRLCPEDIADRVTVEHLLTHSSGLDGDVFDDTGRGDDCVERYVGLLAGAGHDFSPGAACSYCNSGFVVLGRIIEVLDGDTWDASLRTRLSQPLGLTDVLTLPEEAILRLAAVGHKSPRAGGAPYDTWAIPRSAGPAGGITTTAEDLLGYARMHLDRGRSPTGDRVLQEGSVTDMWRLRMAMPVLSPYAGVGLSWRLARWSDTDVLAHNGGTVGQVSALRVLPERAMAVCVFTNGDNGDAVIDPLLTDVLHELAAVDVPPLPVPAREVATAGLERHAGTYRRRGIEFDITTADDMLSMAYRSSFGLPGVEEEAETLAMLPVDDSGDHFVIRSDPTEEWTPVSFGTLPDGRAELTLSGRVAPRV